MEPVRIALAQMRCVAGDVEGNMSRALESIDEAASHGANLLVLPEMCITGYATDGSLPRIPHEGAEVRDLAVRSGEKGMAVCAGLCERCDGMPYDTEVVVEGGELKGYYRKTHLGEREKAAFAAGDHIHCVHASVGILGVPTCWECRFPEISTVMALQGAEALLVPTASGLTAERRREVWDRVLPARAADNSCFVAAVNARGDNGKGVDFGGGATVRGPHGELVAEDYGGDMLVADLDPSELRMRGLNYDTMRDVHYLSRRRPELYGDVVKGRWRPAPLDPTRSPTSATGRRRASRLARTSFRRMDANHAIERARHAIRSNSSVFEIAQMGRFRTDGICTYPTVSKPRCLTFRSIPHAIFDPPSSRTESGQKNSGASRARATIISKSRRWGVA